MNKRNFIHNTNILYIIVYKIFVLCIKFLLFIVQLFTGSIVFWPWFMKFIIELLQLLLAVLEFLQGPGNVLEPRNEYDEISIGWQDGQKGPAPSGSSGEKRERSLERGTPWDGKAKYDERHLNL